LECVLLLPAALLLAFVIAVLARVLLYRQSDDTGHLQAKNAYLARLRGLAETTRGPNLVLILFDDLGYGDLGAYGGQAIRTPNIDRLAAEGMTFHQAYAASPYCSGSRAGLLTGRYPVRAGLDHVVQAPGTLKDGLIRFGGLNRRLPEEEMTLAEVLSAVGYACALIGKWHLGDESSSLPNQRGFDSFYGLLHSNDQGKPVVWRDRQIVEKHPIDQATLTRRYTDEAVRFISASRGRPFFLLLAHTFPHIPLHVSKERLGTSTAGLYGDVVEELDDSVGAVLEALEQSDLSGETLIVVTSDNGPWFQGSPGGLRGRKFAVFEGGSRVPFIVRWPGKTPAGAARADLVSAVDLVPTLMETLGLPLPEDRFLDGRSLLGLLSGEVAGSRESVYFFQLGVLRAVRDRRFKYHDRHGVYFGNPMDWPWGPMRRRGPWLFDLESDPDESYDVSHRHPEVRRRLQSVLEAERAALIENPRGWRSSDSRE
jgi:arylsulfatase A-like enzyme